jgi:DNA-directed RNA polymerase subunit RPC12/RpoP
MNTPLILLMAGAGWLLFLWLFMRRCTPPWRKYWYPRLTLVGTAVPAAFLAAPAVQHQAWGAVLFVVGGVAVINYLALAFVRVCDNCGKIIEPSSLNDPPKNCPRCGTRLFPVRLSDPKPKV